jgi:hypothetical protein
VEIPGERCSPAKRHSDESIFRLLSIVPSKLICIKTSASYRSNMSHAVTWPKKDSNMFHFHAIVWIDHLQAKIFHIGLSGDDQLVLHPHIPTRHLHHKANSIGNGHAAPDQNFFEEVMKAISDAGKLLIIGPSTARIELAKHFRNHNSQKADRIVAVDAADHPSDGEIIAYARKHFGMGLPRARQYTNPSLGNAPLLS